MKTHIAWFLTLLLLCVVQIGCGGQSQKVESSSAAADTPPSTPADASAEEVETDTSVIVLKPLDSETLDASATHTFPDGTHFRYPKDFLTGGSGAELAIHSHTAPELAYVAQLPAEGETDPAADWILARHDELVATHSFFDRGFERSQIVRAQTPSASFANFTCKLVKRDGLVYHSKHSVTILNDRVYFIWSLDRKPRGIEGDNSPIYSLGQSAAGLVDRRPDLVRMIATTIAAGEPQPHAFVNSQHKLARTFVGGDLDRPHHSNRRPRYLAYSLHPDGTLCIGEPAGLQARSGEEDPALVLIPKEGSDAEAPTGRWSEQDGRLTLVWGNRSRTYDIQLLEHDGEQVLIFPDISGSSRQPFVLREHKPLVWFHGDPGAPMVIEEVAEQSSDTPMTVPVVDPTLTSPTPTVTNTPIPTQLMGLTFQGGNADEAQDNSATVFGSKTNASKIVYLIDASGSMVDLLPFVVREVKNSVGRLDAEQNVTVILFSGKGVYEVPGGGGVKGLRPAGVKFKEDIEAWLSIKNHKYEAGGPGSKHVEAAIKRALLYKPEVVFLLSDNPIGGGRGKTQHDVMQEDFIKMIQQANSADPPAKFNTLHFLYPDPLTDAGLTGTLQLLAEETGGDYKYISARELNLE